MATLHNNSGRTLLIAGVSDNHWLPGTTREINLETQPDYSAVGRAYMRGELDEVFEGEAVEGDATEGAAKPARRRR